MSVAGKCITCRFWEKTVTAIVNKSGTQGSCHRYPPAVLPLTKMGNTLVGNMQCSAPITHEKYWCAEYQPSLKATN